MKLKGEFSAQALFFAGTGAFVVLAFAVYAAGWRGLGFLLMAALPAGLLVGCAHFARRRSYLPAAILLASSVGCAWLAYAMWGVVARLM